MIWLFFLAAIPLDPVGDPLPRYLTPVGVAKHLATAAPSLQECVSVGNYTERVSFKIYGDGAVRDVEWSNGEMDVHKCWANAFVGLRFSRHDDLPIHLETTVYVREGSLTLSPQPEISERAVGPLMLFILPENVAKAQRQLHEVNDQADER